MQSQMAYVMKLICVSSAESEPEDGQIKPPLFCSELDGGRRRDGQGF